MVVVKLFDFSVSAVSAVSAVVRNKSRNLPIAKKTDSKSEITNSVVLGKIRFKFILV